MNLKKRCMYTIVGLLILVIGIFTVYAIVDKEKSWHDFSDILVIVDGFNMTLEEAIYYDVLISGATQSYTVEVPNPGHSADEIWVSISGNETTLQDAISTTGFCGYDSPSFSYMSNMTLGQFASEIEISPGTSLQDAINNGSFIASHNSFACDDNDIYWYNSCGVREEKKQECGASECQPYNLAAMCWRCGGPGRIKSITCTDRGCSSGACYATARTQIVASENCATGCATPKCYYCPDCSAICY